MRDPEMFKYDVRVRDRMLRSGRISSEEIGKLLDALPDLDASVEVVPLNQPALDATATAAAAAAAAPRQTMPPASSDDDSQDDDDVDDGDSA